MSPVATTRYPYGTADGGLIPSGVEGFIEYGGLILNDRYQADRYLVKSITGIDDADVVDSREKSAGEHGEDPFDSLYGGRTIVITGQIECGNQMMLRKMKEDLFSAFGELVESPLRFRWWDIFDDFSDPATLGNYTYDVGSGLSVSGGLLVPTAASEQRIYRSSDQRRFVDSRKTIMVRTGASLASTTTLGLVDRQDANNSLSARATFLSGASTIGVYSFDSGAYTVQGTPASFSPQPFTLYWLRETKTDDSILVEVFASDPYGADPVPLASTTVPLSGAVADAHGAGIAGDAGIRFVPATLDWALDDFRVESVYPGDVYCMARKIDRISMADEQKDHTRFVRPFQITMRASHPRFLNGITHQRSLSQPIVDLYGRVYNRTYPLNFLAAQIDSFGNIITPTSASNIVSVNNKGNWTAWPVVRLYGAATNPVVTNKANGQQIILSGSIPDGDYVDVDTKAKTVVYSSGENAIDLLSPTSDWMVLEPRQNDLAYIAGSYSPTVLMRVRWQHTSK